MSALNSQVLIVGSGPTGLTLALWLKRLGVDIRIIDKASGPGETSRALAVQARTLEFDRQLGNLDEPDYQALRDQYERRAIVALGARYRREQELDALIEQQLADLRAEESREAPARSHMDAAPVKATNGAVAAKPVPAPARRNKRRRRV